MGIIGGGPSAAEIAGNTWRLFKDFGGHMTEITLFAGRRFMRRFQPSIADRVRRSLTRRGIGIREEGYIKQMAALEGKALLPFDPGGDYLLIFNLGDGTGILRRGRSLFGGKPAFRGKDYIDRRFMQKFHKMA